MGYIKHHSAILFFKRLQAPSFQTTPHSPNHRPRDVAERPALLALVILRMTSMEGELELFRFMMSCWVQTARAARSVG